MSNRIRSRRLAFAHCVVCTLALSSGPAVWADDDEAFATMDELLPVPPAILRPETPVPHVPAPSSEHGPTSWIERDRLLGDLFGSRTWLDDHGIVIDAELTADFFKPLSGGLDTEGSATLHLFDVMVAIDTERLFNLPGGTLFANFQHLNGQSPDDEVGSLQGLSGIDADGLTQLSEIWYEQRLWDDKLAIIVGKIDSNGIFAVPDGSGEFLNPSFAMSPTMLAMPTYPDPSFGALVSVFPAQWVYARFGIFDGATQEGLRTGSRGPATLFGDPGDLYFIAEAGPTWNFGDDHPGRLGLGVWHHTGTFTRADSTLDDGTTGFYLTADQSIWTEADDQGIAIFAQYGWADDQISEAAHHLSIGAVWSGAIPSRDIDVLGLGISGALVSDDFLPDDEWVIETFYKAQITGWFYIQPGIQYVLNPGGDSANDDAVVLGVRAGMAY